MLENAPTLVGIDGSRGRGPVRQKETVQGSARRGLIDDPERWFSFQKARNRTSHDYDANKAGETYQVALSFVPHVRKLLDELIDRHA